MDRGRALVLVAAHAGALRDGGLLDELVAGEAVTLRRVLRRMRAIADGVVAAIADDDARLGEPAAFDLVTVLALHVLAKMRDVAGSLAHLLPALRHDDGRILSELGAASGGQRDHDEPRAAHQVPAWQSRHGSSVLAFLLLDQPA